MRRSSFNEPPEYLGEAVATAMLSSEQEEPEQNRQVRGYLRWYGDLSSFRGYRPLEEAIIKGQDCAKIEGRVLPAILEKYAQEWNCTTTSVRGSIHLTTQKAVELHPDFAFQVLGGISAPHNTITFIKASVSWLAIHRLSLSINQREAFWQFWPVNHLEREDPYISNEDYQIVREYRLGRTVERIAQDYNYPVLEVKNIYGQTVEVAKQILHTAKDDSDISILEHLKEIGFFPWMDGAAELECAVRLAQADRSLVQARGGELYSAVAKELGIEPKQVPYRIRKIILNAARDEDGQYNKFYLSANIQIRALRISKLVTSILRYIESKEEKIKLYSGTTTE